MSLSPKLETGETGAAVEYERVNDLCRISTMRLALEALPKELRQEVILLGLAKSTAQFTWSYFAQYWFVSQAEWPPNPYPGSKRKMARPRHHALCYVRAKGVCTCRPRPLSVQEKRALGRPINYFMLSGEAQWEIDKDLGILDWNGD